MRWAACTAMIASFTLACASTSRPRYEPQSEPGPTRRRFNAIVADGRGLLATADARAIRGLLQRGVLDGGLWFDDEPCRNQFAQPRLVPEAELDAFAACIAGLHLSRSRRWMLPDVAVMEYAPGIEVEAMFAIGPQRTQLIEIGFVENEVVHGWLPTITSDALEQLRTAGDPLAVDPSMRAALDAAVARSGARFVAAELRVCIGTDGAVTSAHTLTSTSSVAADAFRRGVAAWRFRPLVLAGRPVTACAAVAIVYPPGQASSATDWDPNRIFLPPLDPRTDGAPMGKQLYVGHFEIDVSMLPTTPGTQFAIALRYCAGADGAIYKVEVYQSTGFPALDRQFVDHVKAYRYEPALVDGKPVAACDQSTFEIDR